MCEVRADHAGHGCGGAGGAGSEYRPGCGGVIQGESGCAWGGGGGVVQGESV